MKSFLEMELTSQFYYYRRIASACQDSSRDELTLRPSMPGTASRNGIEKAANSYPLWGPPPCQKAVRDVF
jgi:hypothetical protein